MNRWARSHQDGSYRPAWNKQQRLGWTQAGGGQPAVIACYLWEPRGRKGAGFGAPCTTAGSDQLWLQGGLGHSWSCHNIDPGGDNIQRAWSPSRIRRGMSPEKIPGPQGIKLNGALIGLFQLRFHG